MRLILFLALNFNLVFAYSTQAELENLSDKDSHAVLPGDVARAACQVEIKDDMSKKEIYMQLRGKGHDLRVYLNDSRFELKHFKDIYQAVMLMPEWLKLGRRNSAARITYKIDTSRNAVASYKSSTVYINPNRWHKFVQDMRVSILFHELSHSLGEAIYNLDDSKLWENVDGGWKARSFRRDGSISTGSALNYHNYVSDYAMTNPAEDFAESVSSYRVKPKELKSASPLKYSLIREVVFFNQEFLDNSNCNPSSDDLIKTEKIQDYLVEKLAKSSHYFDRAYKYLTSRRGVRSHPTAMERLLFENTVRILISKLGAFRDTTKNDYRFKHILRVFLKNTDNLDFLRTSYTDSLVRKLKLNKNITY